MATNIGGFVKENIKKRIGDDDVKALAYIDILKALRDQVLGCTFISIAAADKDQANRIFAILNAKGKRLAYIDLIKNKIFEILREGVSGTLAEDRWEGIKEILNTGSETVGLATYYRHYWISKYQRCNASALYDKFISKINKNEMAYREFLEDLYSNAENYMLIVNPRREDYENRKEYFWLVQSLKDMNETFGVVQTRIALLALYDVKKRNIISAEQFKKAVLMMENFHFAFTAVCSQRTNNLESLYSRFAIALRKCTGKLETSAVICDKLIEPLNKLFPTYEVFSSHFKELYYSTKKENPVNVKTKYAINKINAYFSDKELFEDDGSIEHILPETVDEQALNIGNLILLEGKINNDAGNDSYAEKLQYYKKSKYSWVGKFIENHEKWEKGDMISKRAEELASIYYYLILKRSLPSEKKKKIETYV